MSYEGSRHGATREAACATFWGWRVLVRYASSDQMVPTAKGRCSEILGLRRPFQLTDLLGLLKAT